MFSPGRESESGGAAGQPARATQLLLGEDTPRLVTAGAVSAGGRVAARGGREALLTHVN